MHDHAKHSLDTMPDPAKGQTSRFWDDDTQYTLAPHFDRWILHRHAYGSADPLVTLHRRDGGWRAIEVNGNESWDGESVAEVLRPQL